MFFHSIHHSIITANYINKNKKLQKKLFQFPNCYFFDGDLEFGQKINKIK